jgi:cyanophycinase
MYFVLALSISVGASAQTQTFQYFRLGNAQDVSTKASPGYALLGGGEDLDEAFKWLCAKGGGGDFLVLRARVGRGTFSLE